ncbi:hypothetical protein J7E37_11835 [Bacillus sp. ISL-39]|nr:hypothetical protein [Bacillus sp. ISL-39]
MFVFKPLFGLHLWTIHLVPKVLEEIDQYEFDAAFVSAGIPANLICVDIAKRGKVAIDLAIY